MSHFIKTRSLHRTLFVAILFMEVTGSWSNTTVSVKFISYQNNRQYPCGQSCDFSFYICLGNDYRDLQGRQVQADCAYNVTDTGTFFNQYSITFAESEANPIIAYVPKYKIAIHLKVVVFELGQDNRNWLWDNFTLLISTRPVPVVQQALQITGSLRNTRLTFGYATSCTPPFYLMEGSCAKVCQARDDQLGHYNCTPDGDKECLQGWYDPSMNCTRPQPKTCHCSNGATCDTDGKCVCSAGFTGMDCSQDVDECMSGKAGACDDNNNTVCRNIPGSYACNCKSGYTGNRCQYRLSSMTTGPSVSPSSSGSVDPSETPVSSKHKNLILPIGVAGGLLLLVILVVVLIVFIIRQRKRMTRATEAPGIATLADQRESRRATSTEAHSNPYVMDESTFTKNNGALPADGVHPIYDNYKGGAVLPPYRLNEIPGPRDSLFIVDNVTYESSGNVGTVEDMTAVYANVKK